MSNAINQMDRFGPAYAAHFANEGKHIAFVAVYHSHEGEEGPALGIAVANERGFTPVPKYIFSASTIGDAEKIADNLNAEVLRLKRDRYAAIVASTMGGRPC